MEGKKLSKLSVWLIIAGLIAAACGPGAVPVETDPTNPPEPTAVPRVCDGECQASIMAAIDIIDSAGFHAMSEDLNQAAVLVESAPALGVLAAQDVIDSSGFHGMSEAIAEATSMEDISPRTVGTVEHALWVSRVAPYPASVQEALSAFQADAEALIAALSDGDLEAAQEAAHGIHGTQHDLSHEAFEYLAGQESASLDPAFSVAAVMAAQDIIDSAGFHGISEAIAEAATMEDVSPRTVGSVEQALWASKTFEYPEDLAEALSAFQADAEALIEALSEGELEAAKVSAAAIHGSQHHLSDEAYAWLADQSSEAGSDLLIAVGVIAAQDVIDSSGFHGMSEAIAEATSMEDVSPRTLGTVEKTLFISRAVSYPESTSENLAAFQADAEALVASLSAGELEEAKEASHAIHSSQHDLSNAVFAWLSEQDSAALMAGLINSRFLGTVENAYAVVQSVNWPDELSDPAAAFSDDLAVLAAALEANDVAIAAEAGGAIHGSQHDLSHEVYHWLGEQEAQTTQIEAIAAAMDIVDSAGFHGMSEEIEAAGSMEDVSPRNLGRVENALAAAVVIDWPQSLVEVYEAFRADAGALAEALENGDLEAAQEASHAIHESQHSLSHDAYVYLADNPGAAASRGAVLAAQDVIDSAGFHGMAHDIEHAESMEDVNPRFLSTVEKVVTVTRMVSWPQEIQGAAENFLEDVEALAEALDSGDLAGAKEASGAVHSTQHDLAHETYAWIGADVEFVQGEQTSEESTSDHEAGEEALPEEYSEAIVVSLTVGDWYWEPTTLRLEQGVPVVLEIVNEGVMPHGIWIPQLNINENTPPGDVTRVPLTPNEAGTFTILCNNEMCGGAEQHQNMTAEIVVE